MVGLLRAFARDVVRTRVSLALENALLRKQLEILERRRARPIRTRPRERAWLVALASMVPDWRRVVRVVEPATLVRWHRRGFRAYWEWKSRAPVDARRAVLRALILRIAGENPLWGSRRIEGELAKLGVVVSRRTVQRILRSSRPRAPRHGQTWRTFVRNHLNETWAADLFTVPTIWFETLHVLVLMKLGTREVVRWAVTEHPTQEWTAHQLREATAWCVGPRFLVRDRDAKLGRPFDDAARACGTRVRLTPPRAPQANAFVERLIGSVRRECLDHLIVLGRTSLERILDEYSRFYNEARPHQGIAQRTPSEVERPRVRAPPRCGRVIGRPVLGGLHHDYRIA